MKNKVVEIANEQGLTGMKRVGFYMISPIVVAVSFVVGYAIGVVKSLKKSI